MRITFTVDRPTDVEVAVLGADGAILRHLAAGRVGPHAPPPLQAGVLAQTLTWDGHDDAGRAVKDIAACRVRVGLGLTGRLHRVIGWNGDYFDAVRGIATGPDGALYVLYGGGLYAHRTTTLIARCDRQGRYVRQVFPPPAGLPAEKRAGWPHLTLDDGRRVPVIGHLLTRAVLPGAVFGNRVSMAVTRDGRLVMLSGLASTVGIKHADARGGHRLLVLGTDGSVGQDWLGPSLGAEALGGTGRIALSSDEKQVYVAGFFDPDRGKVKGKGHCHVVWRRSLAGVGEMEVFAGRPFRAGTGAEGLNDPQGLATDADGNVYVADYGNNRIAIFSPDKKYLGQIAVDRPDSVCVSRKTGAVYVMTIEAHPKPLGHQHYYVAAHNWRGEEVVKFASRRAKNPTWRYRVGRRPKTYGGGAYLALDESGEQPVLWVAGIRYFHAGWARLVDRGETVEDQGDVFAAHATKRKLPALGFLGDVTVVGRTVLTRHPAFGNHTAASYAYDAETGEPMGEFTPLADAKTKKRENMWNLLYGEMAAGKDGNLYVLTAKTLRRYKADGSPLPFPATGTHVLTGFFHGHTRHAGFFVDGEGGIFVLSAAADRKLADLYLRLVSPDGEIAPKPLLHVQNARAGGIALDHRHDLYVGLQIAPVGKRLPAWAAGRLPPDSKTHHPSIDYKQCGSLVKFPITGGAVLQDPKGDYEAHLGWKAESRVRLESALWVRRLGLHPVKHEMGCYCETTRFDVDRFGRVFVPDIYRFCVVVLDSAGNEITRVGAYGNMDSRGPGSPVPTPALPLGWPLTVECARGRIYIADLVNRRVVSADLPCVVSRTCPVR